MITIKEFTNQIEAGMLQSLLKDNEIESVLANEHSAAWGRAALLIPIGLQVTEDQAEKAISLIKQYETSLVVYDDSDLDGEPVPKPQCQIGDDECTSCT